MGLVRTEGGAVAAYDYRCRVHGDVEERFPIGLAPATIRCPTCDADAVRVYGSAAVVSHDPLTSKMMSRQQLSGERPMVVERSPVTPPRRASTQDPRWQRLPRP